MPDRKRIRIYCEGDDDRAVLKALKQGQLLSDRFDLANPSHGKDRLADDLAPFVSPDGVSGWAVILRDHDNLSSSEIGDWFGVALRERIRAAEIVQSREPTGRVTTFAITAGTRTGRAAVIPVGLPEANPLCAGYGFNRFAVDYYLLVLAHEEAIYSGVPEVKDVAHALAIKKLAEVLDLMRRNGIPVEQSKRALHLFRAITGFRASPATFAERLVGKAIEAHGTETIRGLMQPLLGDIELAEQWFG